jgi:hypothetical protein
LILHFAIVARRVCIHHILSSFFIPHPPITCSRAIVGKKVERHRRDLTAGTTLPLASTSPLERRPRPDLALETAAREEEEAAAGPCLERRRLRSDIALETRQEEEAVAYLTL